MKTNHQTNECPSWLKNHAEWHDTDQRDFLIIAKGFEKFSELTGDPKLAAVLVMAWATLQAGPKGD